MTIAFSPNSEITPELLEAFRAKYAQGEPEECWLWTSHFVGGSETYGRFVYRRQRFIASRIAYLVHNGSLGRSELVCHKCDNPPCVNPAHLFAGSWRDNSADRQRKGRGYNPAGDKHPGAILSSEDVRAIRASADSQRSLGRTYGVNHSTIGLIKRRQKWSHVR